MRMASKCGAMLHESDCSCDLPASHQGEHRQYHDGDGYVSWPRAARHADSCTCQDCWLQTPALGYATSRAE